MTETESSAMIRDDKNIPLSAQYTSAAWKWAGMPEADVVTPEGAMAVFAVINGYNFVYKLVNWRYYSLKHMLLHRHSGINHLIARADHPLLIEVAAGFSPRGCHASSDPARTCFEIDRPDVVAMKHAILEDSERGAEILARPNYHLEVGDVTDLDFEARFPAGPAFIVTEGLMMYFDREEQLDIWRRIAKRLAASGGEYVFDYIPLPEEPERSWLGKLLSKLKNALKVAPMALKYDDRTTAQVVEDLRSAGFGDVEAIRVSDVAAEWGIPSPEQRTCVLLFHCKP